MADARLKEKLTLDISQLAMEAMTHLHSSKKMNYIWIILIFHRKRLNYQRPWLPNMISCSWVQVRFDTVPAIPDLGGRAEPTMGPYGLTCQDTFHLGWKGELWGKVSQGMFKSMTEAFSHSLDWSKEKSTYGWFYHERNISPKPSQAEPAILRHFQCDSPRNCPPMNGRRNVGTCRAQQNIRQWWLTDPRPVQLSSVSCEKMTF